MRPDYTRLQRQHHSLNASVGQTALMRHYVSGDGTNSGQYGIGVEPQFLTTTITALMVSVTQDEINAPGGVFEAGDMMATMEVRPGGQAEIVWQGTTYRVASEPLPIPLMGNVRWRVHLRRGGATA